MDLSPYNWKSLSPQPVIGVDEVGRGCLAGPVMAAACFLKSDLGLDQFTDSKLISKAKREKLAPFILQNHLVCVGSASVEEIFEINILKAALLAMKRAVLDLQKQMQFKEATILVDGNMKIPGLGPEFHQITLVKGDLRAAPISAASIVAKVARDQLMLDLSQEYPNYGFEKHKGYASELHRKMIQKHGPTEIHRKAFGGVREHLA